MMADDNTQQQQQQQPPPKACTCGCGWWTCWLQSWSTPGGNLILLSKLTILFTTATIFLMVKYGPGTPAVITLVSITSGFAVAITTRMGIDQRSQHSRSSDTSPTLNGTPGNGAASATTPNKGG